jgi:hypothetical protein
MKLKDKKTFAVFTGKIDKKNKLNRSSKKLDVNLLTQIDNGTTIENLIELSKKYSLPIFKYQTQITIHGIFNELGSNYCYGYKHIIQNKNKSIGIKYGAIDEVKRQYLKKYLRYIGFNYSRSTNNQSFELLKRSFNINDAKNDVIELQKTLKKIDKNLFFGGANIIQGNYLGAIYTILDLTINAIEQKNIDLFLENLGITKEFIKNKEIQIEREKIEREKKYKLERIERENKKELTKNELIKIRENDFKNYSLELPKENNIYINVYSDWNNVLKYKLIKVLPQGRKKLQRYLEREYSTLNEALNDLKNFKEYNSSLFEKISKFGLKESYKIS